MSKITYICLAAAFGGLLFGFDTAVISGAVSLLKSQFTLHTAMQGWLVSSGLVGCVIGVFTTGILSDRIGRKKTILLSAFMFLLSGIGCAFAASVSLLITFRIIGGIGVGMASVVSPMLISEFAPADKRGKMVSYYQLAITIGILLAYFSNALVLSIAKSNIDNSWMHWFVNMEPWRPMFLAMTIPSIVFIILLAKVPESPRWLVHHKKSEEAVKILNSIRQPQQAIKELHDIENAAKKSVGKSSSLFTKALQLPLFIGIVMAVLQQFSGINAIIYYGPSIFESAGIASSNALYFQVIIGAVNLIFTFIAIRSIDTYGRKLLLKIGLTGIIFSLVVCGALFYTGHTQGWFLLLIILLYISCFAFSLGPITWVIINEIFPTEVRVKGVALCTLALWIAVWIVGQFFPWLLQNVGAAVTFWIFAGCSIINLFFSWNIVKETKGKTLEEMDETFTAPH